MQPIIYSFAVFISLLLLLYLDSQSHNKLLKATLLTIIIIFLSFIGNYGGLIGLGFSFLISLFSVVKIVGYKPLASLAFTIATQIFSWAILSGINKLILY